MNFKLLSLIVVAFIAFSSCTDFLKGKSEQKDVLKIQIADEACASDFKSQLQKIVKSEASEVEINLVFDCVDKYMSQFQNKVEGEKNADQFNTQDFLYVTNRFFKDLELTSEAIQKIIHLKRALVGGTSDVVTKNEINQLRTFFNTVVKPQVQHLKRYFRIINPKVENLTTSRAEVSLAHVELEKSVKVLFENSNFAESQYSYNDAKNLLESLEILKTDDSDLLKIIDRVRQLLLGDQILTAKTEYNIFIENAILALELYGLSRHKHIKFEMTSIQSTAYAIEIADRIVHLLESSYQFKKTGRISTHDLDDVLEVIIDKKVFPYQLQFKTLQEFYKIALKRIFYQETSDFMTATQFAAYHRESALFKLQIDFTQSMNKKSYKVNELQKLYQTFLDTKALHKIDAKLSSKDKIAVKNNFAALSDDLNDQFPAMVKNDKYIVSKAIMHESFAPMDLLRGFYIKMWARQLLMGWGNGKSVPVFKEAFVLESQMDVFKKEFNQMGIELKINDPRDLPKGAKSFLEADLFGFSSNGNQKMNLSEGIEYLHYLVTDGAWTTDQIRKDLSDRKCEIDELDIFGNHWNRESCFITNLKHNYSRYFVSKPDLVKYLSKLSDSEFNSYYYMLMDVARFEAKNKNKKIETVDIQTFVVLTSYVEAMFVKHDADRSMTLSASEIRQSYPKFKAFATSYSVKHAAESLKQWDSPLNSICNSIYTKQDLIKESFIFMVLNEGRMPLMKDVNYILCEYQGLFDFKNEIDRKSIIYTFLVLKDVLASDK